MTSIAIVLIERSLAIGLYTTYKVISNNYGAAAALRAFNMLAPPTLTTPIARKLWATGDPVVGCFIHHREVRLFYSGSEEALNSRLFSYFVPLF